MRMWPIRSFSSVNHMLPSGPAMIKKGSLSSATRYSVTFPAGERQPIFPPLFSQNQMLPSGPAAMPIGPLLRRGDIELRHFPFYRHPPDFARSPLGEPESAVSAEADAPG